MLQVAIHFGKEWTSVDVDMFIKAELLAILNSTPDSMIRKIVLDLVLH